MSSTPTNYDALGLGPVAANASILVFCAVQFDQREGERERETPNTTASNVLIERTNMAEEGKEDTV